MTSLQSTLADGRVPVGHMVTEFWTRGIARLLAASGADFVIFDMEHSGWTMDDLADQMAWMRATQLTAVVRPPVGTYEYIARALDIGAHGVMAPRVESADETRAVVQAAKYPPVGGRGFSLAIAQDDYRGVESTEVVDRANAESLVIVQIETPRGLEDLDAIVGVEGVDIAWFGPHDFALSSGLMNERSNGGIQDAAARVARACEERGKFAGIQVTHPDEAREYIRLGYRCVSFEKDVNVYRKACARGFEDVREQALEAGYR